MAKLRAVSSYIIQLDRENRDLDGLTMTHEIEVLPVSGTLVESSGKYRKGLRMIFQWNALLSAPRMDDLAVIDEEYIYRIGTQMLNDWCFVEPTDFKDGIYQARLISKPILIPEYKIGISYLYESSKAHRIETHGFNSLNPHGHPLQAIKYYDLLASVLVTD